MPLVAAAVVPLVAAAAIPLAEAAATSLVAAAAMPLAEAAAMPLVAEATAAPLVAAAVVPSMGQSAALEAMTMPLEWTRVTVLEATAGLDEEAEEAEEGPLGEVVMQGRLGAVAALQVAQRIWQKMPAVLVVQGRTASARITGMFSQHPPFLCYMVLVKYPRLRLRPRRMFCQLPTRAATAPVVQRLDHATPPHAAGGSRSRYQPGTEQHVSAHHAPVHAHVTPARAGAETMQRWCIPLPKPLPPFLETTWALLSVLQQTLRNSTFVRR